MVCFHPGTFVDSPGLLPPLSSDPAPQTVKDHLPSFPPSTLVLPPNISTPLPVSPKGNAPALAPGAANRKSHHVEYPSPEFPGIC